MGQPMVWRIQWTLKVLSVLSGWICIIHWKKNSNRENETIANMIANSGPR